VRLPRGVRGFQKIPQACQCPQGSWHSDDRPGNVESVMSKSRHCSIEVKDANGKSVLFTAAD
jgi:hypothetical protein